jgi:hypothetical protein
MTEVDLDALEETIQLDTTHVYSHALWMARVICEIRDDPAFKKLGSALREDIMTICAAVE